MEAMSSIQPELEQRVVVRRGSQFVADRKRAPSDFCLQGGALPLKDSGSFDFALLVKWNNPKKYPQLFEPMGDCGEILQFTPSRSSPWPMRHAVSICICPLVGRETVYAPWHASQLRTARVRCTGCLQLQLQCVATLTNKTNTLGGGRS